MDASSAKPANPRAPREGGGEALRMAGSPREVMQLTVRQPESVRSLLLVLSDLERIAERVGEDRSQDLGGGGVSGGTGGDRDGIAQVSLRQQAIQRLPLPPVMQRRLVAHLEREVRSLEREARRVSRRLRKGSAYLLTQLYARIRKIQALIAEILEAAVDVIQRLYIRLFIDHQQLI